MKKLLITLLCIPLLLSNCNKTVENDLLNIKVNPKTQDSLLLSTIVKSIEYIPLETHPEALLGRYGSPGFFNNGIIVSGAKSLYCFDLNGKFKYKISRTGKGPGEYQGISSYLIDENLQRIEIMDQRSRKLLRFNLRDGSFIEELTSIIFAQNIALLNDSSYVFYTGGDGSEISGGTLDWNNKIIITDRDDLTIRRKYFPGECRLVGQYPFVKSTNSFKVHLPYNDTIYQLTKDTILPYLFVDFAQFSLPEGYCYLDYEQQRAIDKSNMAYLSNAIESDQYFLFKWGYKNRLRNHLWSKSNEAGIDFFWLHDDIDGLNQYISFRKWENGKLLATFNSVDILTQNGIENEKIYQKLIDKGWVPDESSNPIIALYEVVY